MSEQPTMPEDSGLTTMPEDSGLTTMPERSGLSTKQKAFFILLDSSLIVATIASYYWSTKMALKTIFGIFDNIIDTIELPTKKIKKKDRLISF